LAQTSIAKFYTRRPRIHSTDNLDGYLRTIVVNTYLSARRGPWWRRVALHHSPTEAPSFDPDITARAELRDALAAIPPRQRAAIVLRYYCARLLTWNGPDTVLSGGLTVLLRDTTALGPDPSRWTATPFNP
jgi:hypothetical protein